MPKTNYKPLYAILLCFALPIISAYLLFYYDYAKHYNNPQGTLVQPSIQLQNLKTKTWKIAYLQNDTAIDTSRQQIISKRHIALGKDKHRVETILLQAKPTINNQWPTQSLASLYFDKLYQLQDNKQQPCRYFIIDPRGQVVLCYPQDIAPKAIDQDLRKLLKNSRIG